MAAVRVLLRADRLNALRAATSKGAWRSMDRLMLGAIFAVVAMGQLASSAALVGLTRPSAPAEIHGLPTRVVAAQLLEASLIGLFATWLLLPLFARGLLVRGRSLSLSHLLQYPVTVREAFSFSALSTLASPGHVGVGLLSLVTLAPLVAMEHPAAGLAGGALFVVAAIALSWSIGLVASALLTAARGRAIALGLASAFLLLAATPVFVSTHRSAEGLKADVVGREVLLLSVDGERGLFPAMARAAPSHAVVRLVDEGWKAGPLAFLVALAAGAIAVSVVAFRRCLTHPPVTAAPRRARRFSAPPFTSLPFLRDPLRALAEKELAYLFQTMDALLVALLGLVAAAVAWRAQELWWVAIPLLPFMAMNELAIPTNAFGLDRGGVDRYALAPITARQVLLSKNLAWAWLVAWQSLPVVLALGARHGLRMAVAAAGLQAAYVIFMASWGNVVSVQAPAPREMWNFDSPSQTGGIASQVVLVLAAAGLAVAWLLASGADRALAMPDVVLPAAMLALAGVSALGWLVSLRWASAEMTAQPERIRARLVA